MIPTWQLILHVIGLVLIFFIMAGVLIALFNRMDKK